MVWYTFVGDRYWAPIKVTFCFRVWVNESQKCSKNTCAGMSLAVHTIQGYVLTPKIYSLAHVFCLLLPTCCQHVMFHWSMNVRVCTLLSFSNSMAFSIAFSSFSWPKVWLPVSKIFKNLPCFLSIFWHNLPSFLLLLVWRLQ